MIRSQLLFVVTCIGTMGCQSGTEWTRASSPKLPAPPVSEHVSLPSPTPVVDVKGKATANTTDSSVSKGWMPRGAGHVSPTEESVDAQITLVSLIQEDESDLPDSEAAPREENALIEGLPARPIETDDPESPGSGLSMADVVRSSLTHFPEIQSALLEAQLRQGTVVEKLGEFDTKLSLFSRNQPLGFYENFRQGISVDQPLYGGGQVKGGYRIGNGLFEPWYGERQTDEGGEFSFGVELPFLRGRRIDQRRAELLIASLGRERAEPFIRNQMIEVVYMATIKYWEWVAAGQALQVQQDLVQLAKDRQEALERQVEVGRLSRPEVIDNERLIASRMATLTKSQAILRKAAIELSLYYRNVDGQPIVPTNELLPQLFPMPNPRQRIVLEDEIQRAYQQRPVLRDLALQREQVETELAKARNDMLPIVNGALQVKDDVGALASPKGDKAPTELFAGIEVSSPVQRRKARGKIQQTQSKLGQIFQKRRLAENKISNEVQTAYTLFEAALEQIEYAKESVSLAEQMAIIERRRLFVGDSDILRVNLREEAAAQAQFVEITALAAAFEALAALEAATADNVPPQMTYLASTNATNEEWEALPPAQPPNPQPEAE